MTAPHRLHGTPGSLYTAKVRSFLIKQGIPFENVPAGAPSFRERVVPAVGRWIIPVLETPQGDLIQDGSEIIDRFERQGGLCWPTLPATPVLQVVARLFELFGGEGLFFAVVRGPGTVWLQSLPFSRLASRIFAAAPQTGGGGREQGGLSNLFGGDSDE